MEVIQLGGWELARVNVKAWDRELARLPSNNGTNYVRAQVLDCAKRIERLVNPTELAEVDISSVWGQETEAVEEGMEIEEEVEEEDAEEEEGEGELVLNDPNVSLYNSGYTSAY
jgi:hypothetical protein